MPKSSPHCGLHSHNFSRNQLKQEALQTASIKAVLEDENTLLRTQLNQLFEVSEANNKSLIPAGALTIRDNIVMNAALKHSVEAPNGDYEIFIVKKA